MGMDKKGKDGQEETQRFKLSFMAQRVTMLRRTCVTKAEL